MGIEIACAIFVVTLGIGYLLKKSKDKMGGGWGYKFNLRKNARRE